MIETKFIVWYLLCALMLVAGLGIPYLLGQSRPQSDEHYMGTNLTRVNDSHCTVTWLGGWDYDSFIQEIRVNNVSMGHPLPYSVIYSGNCGNIRVEAYDKTVKSYLEIANYTE